MKKKLLFKDISRLFVFSYYDFDPSMFIVLCVKREGLDVWGGLGQDICILCLCVCVCRLTVKDILRSEISPRNICASCFYSVILAFLHFVL